MLTDVLGKKLRECRLRHGMTQEILAEHLHISHQVISKWENGIAPPDIVSLAAIAQIFGVSIDYLCGFEADDTGQLLKELAEKAPYTEVRDYDSLLEHYPLLAEKLRTHPLNDRLLAYALRYLRQMHDTVRTDEEKEWVNDNILSTAQRILDNSTNDDFRSQAHYNLALYYTEQIVRRGESDPHGELYARKAREHAERVYYKDMDPVFYHDFGHISDEACCSAYENAVQEAFRTLTRLFKNLDRFYRRLGQTEKQAQLALAAEKLQQAMSVCG